MQLAYSGFSHFEDPAYFSQREIFIIIQDKHFLFFVGQFLDGFNDDTPDFLAFKRDIRIGAVQRLKRVSNRFRLRTLRPSAKFPAAKVSKRKPLWPLFS